MCKRCRNPNCDDYKNYGARGIDVSPKWPTAKEFIEWSLTHGYADNLTIERNEVDGPYSPENCCWIPRNKQNRNTRKSIKIEVNGLSLVASEWDTYLGLYKGCIARYYHLHGEASVKVYIENLLLGIPTTQPITVM